MRKKIYIKERQDIINKVFEILNINESNNILYLRDLDANEEMQKQILELETDIRKYFVSGAWACFGCPNIKRKVLSIIKYLMKTMNYNIITKRKLLKTGDIKHQETLYYFVKNNKII